MEALCAGRSPEPVSGPRFDGDPSSLDELSLAAARALAARRFQDALELADRLSRLRRHDNPADLTLCAIAAERLGDLGVARKRVRRARQCDPNHLPAARIAMTVLRGAERLAAAKTVLKLDEAESSLLQAARALRRQPMPLATVSTVGGTVLVRVLSRPGGKAAILRVRGGEVPGLAPDHRRIVADPLIDEWRFLRPAGESRVEIGLEGEVERSIAVGLDPADGFPVPRGPVAGGTPILNVVVPVYGDLEATTSCLDALRDQIVEDFRLHVVLVDDATPSNPIRDRLIALRDELGWTLVSNPRNLGFTGAVNRGLAACLDGDVVLLNADTVPASRALARLREVALAHPGMGTLTPFSNNGQYVSFPVPFTQNEMPDGPAIETLSDAAWAANGAAAVPVPSGIGFCLFIRRDCMAACRRLGEQFDRGYYEDVDLCLRAERLGWVNGCATGVYVAHRGSRSFGDEKALLAARNRTVLERAHPGFALRAAAWLARDPLAPSRERIEGELPPAPGPTSLFVAVDDASSQRGRKLARLSYGRGEPAFLARVGERGGVSALLLEGTGSLPRNRAFPLPLKGGEFTQFLARHSVRRSVVLDPAGLAEDVLDALAAATTIEVEEGDGGLFCPRRSLLNANGLFCGLPDDPAVCGRCVREGGSASPLAAAEGVARWRARWSELAFGDGEVSRGRIVERLAKRSGSRRGSRRSDPPGSGDERRRLALVPASGSVPDSRLLLALGAALSLYDIQSVVFGETLVDGALFARFGIFATGPLKPADLAEATRIYRTTHTMLASPGFAPAHPIAAAATRLPTPLARFRFPFETRHAGAGDLLLDVDLPTERIAASLADWLRRDCEPPTVATAPSRRRNPSGQD